MRGFCNKIDRWEKVSQEAEIITERVTLWKRKNQL
jgi:hypothetical protein